VGSKLTGPEIKGAVEDVEQVEVCVEFVRRDDQRALGLRELEGSA